LATEATPCSHLTASHALMWRIESDPVLPSPILVIGLLDRMPSDAEVRAALVAWQQAFPGRDNASFPHIGSTAARAYGEYISPDEIQTRLRIEPLIAQAEVVSDNHSPT
jgi:hypothetical protein